MAVLYMFGLGMSIWGFFLNVMAGEIGWAIVMMACVAINTGGIIKEFTD